MPVKYFKTYNTTFHDRNIRCLYHEQPFHKLEPWAWYMCARDVYNCVKTPNKKRQANINELTIVYLPGIYYGPHYAEIGYVTLLCVQVKNMPQLIDEIKRQFGADCVVKKKVDSFLAWAKEQETFFATKRPESFKPTSMQTQHVMETKKQIAEARAIQNPMQNLYSATTVGMMCAPMQTPYVVGMIANHLNLKRSFFGQYVLKVYGGKETPVFQYNETGTRLICQFVRKYEDKVREFMRIAQGNQEEKRQREGTWNNEVFGRT